MSSEIDIRVRNLSKVYRIYEKPEHRLIQMATLGRIRPFTEFAALHDINLDVRRGETVGIIGRNGCGKSTLLQIICGTLQPTAGSVEVQGRIAALLELGAGFNAEFTGRENVYMNGAILGFSREEMDARFESIAAFAGIGDFIERPVKMYSSGMFVRLAFAVAAAVEPDILVVDEALAVGDEAFQRKCFARIEAIKERGGTILFVSHGAQTIVQLCDRAVLLDAGEKLLEGEPKGVVSQYQRLINLTGADALRVREEIKAMVAPAADSESRKEGATATAVEEVEIAARDDSWFDPGLVSTSTVEYESRGARISNVRVLAADGRRVNILRLGHRYSINYEVEFQTAANRLVFGTQVKTLTGLMLAGANNIHDRSETLHQVESRDLREISIEFTCRLLPGTYLFDVGVVGAVGEEDYHLHRILDVLMIRVLPEPDVFDRGYFSLDTILRVSMPKERELFVA
ncbi:MAG: ABC transporter ATP-binding protein [Hyphomicrobiales bacterium]|nr:ABC transporter ATP-binding protein [Hyphomicrobiales bacterium]